MDGIAALGGHVQLRGKSVAALPSISNGAVPYSIFLPSRSRSLKLDVSTGHGFGLTTRKRTARVFLVRASADDGGSFVPIAPFQPESPTGQFLTQLLKSHPHLVPAAVERELERLAENQGAEGSQEQPKSSGTDLVLYRRIAELKAQERRKALEEIVYTLIVQKFVEAGIAMVPSLSFLTSTDKPWRVPMKELESVHSMEVLEMIRDHLTLVLGGRGSTEYLDQNTFAQISKLHVGQVYAASIMYGYFLRRIYNRFQLEKNMKLLPAGLGESVPEDETASQQAADANGNQEDGMNAEVAAAMAVLRGLGGVSQLPNANAVGVKPSKLRSYIMSFDMETLQRCATIRSKESLSVLEKHTEALFGRPEIRISPDGSMRVNKDEVLQLSFSGLKSLVLEAVAFGSFLWDVESYVDSYYSFVTN